MKKQLLTKLMLFVLIILMLQSCNSQDINMDKCRPPMFGFGAVLSDSRNSKYKDGATIEFEVSSNSSVTALSNISVTVHYPKEVTLRHRIYDNSDETITMSNNAIIWQTKSIAGYKSRGGSIPIMIKNGILSSPIICEAKVTYMEQPGCQDGGMMEATYAKTVELTTKGRKDSEWSIVHP